MKLVDNISVTTCTVNDTYNFQVRLSGLELARLSDRNILGINFRKSKYEFLNDVAQILTIEILQNLEAIYDNESTEGKGA